MANKPYMINEDVLNLLISAGINPKTGLPLKVSGNDPCELKSNILKTLRVLDEQDAIHRYKWYNLPCNLSGEELERLLYYRGQLCFFYIPDLDSFYFMPYALDGSIDFYGRFKTIHPVPYSSGTEEDPKNPTLKAQADYLSTIRLDVLYDIPDEVSYDLTTKSCVLLHDYSKQMSQTIISRQALQDPILATMSECFPLMRTALFNGTGVKGMRVTSADEASNVIAANSSMNAAALSGRKYVAIQGQLDFQDLAPESPLTAEEYLIAMQAIDNFRLSLYGLDSGGLFQKKSHMLESEQSMNAGRSKAALLDGLSIRQRFCDICNNVFGTVMSCELSETAIGMDMDGDGIASDEKDQSGTMQGDQPPEVNNND